MTHTVVAPNDLRWTGKRLIVPTGLRPLTRTDILDAAAPRRTVVDGVPRQVPDAMGAWTGPLPLGFLFLPLVLPLVPLLLLRRLRWLPWTIEAQTHPWGRRYPPVVLTHAVRGDEESGRGFGQLVAALAWGEGAPVIDGAEKPGHAREPHGGVPVVGQTAGGQLGK